MVAVIYGFTQFDTLRKSCDLISVDIFRIKSVISFGLYLILFVNFLSSNDPCRDWYDLFVIIEKFFDFGVISFQRILNIFLIYDAYINEIRLIINFNDTGLFRYLCHGLNLYCSFARLPWWLVGLIIFFNCIKFCRTKSCALTFFGRVDGGAHFHVLQANVISWAQLVCSAIWRELYR